MLGSARVALGRYDEALRDADRAATWAAPDDVAERRPIQLGGPRPRPGPRAATLADGRAGGASPR